jgi:sugar-specific transcriptional regulator TrmB
MNKSIALIVILMFALALGAGVVAGKLSARGSVVAPTIETGTLSDELKLTADQQKQMQQIWGQMQSVSRQCLEDAKEVQARQNKALEAMLTEEQLKKWSQITTQSDVDIKVLDAKRKEALDNAINRTNALLNETQRKTYKQLINNRLGPGAGAQSLSQNMERF